MDKKIEQVLRKTCFPVMANHLINIRGGMSISVSDVCTLLKVSRPTAKKYMEILIIEGKALPLVDKKGKLFIQILFLGYTDKEVERAKMAYSNLEWELSQ